MKLDWCKITPAETEKFGSWVSENWMRLGHISKWVFSNFDEITPDVQFNFPTKPVQQWNNRENEGWLQYYGLARNGLAIEKRHYVLENINGGDLKTPEERTGSTDNVENVVGILSATLSLIMQQEVDVESITEIDHHICIFLHH
eukprot:4594763-Ditylum_brightwellii.AAC.1